MDEDLRELASDLADLRDGLADLEQEAARLERLASDRYSDSAWRYRGGSSTFVRSIDTADGYVKEAKQLRAEIARGRATIRETEKNFPAVVGMKVR